MNRARNEKCSRRWLDRIQPRLHFGRKARRKIAEDGGRGGGGSPHRRRFVNRPLATLQCGRKVRESRFHWPARSRPCA
ncbi:hypothetical protein X777_14221 [Ooceraea biroi]|uniref:Uncharacterized protein n=1 Tax=Ooceraea biroi TaxID=2015173 RepID=A0A026VWL1_OOCBI|nr:hypothetical protein X777_14221 [Ooceraea biroi]